MRQRNNKCYCCQRISNSILQQQQQLFLLVHVCDFQSIVAPFMVQMSKKNSQLYRTLTRNESSNTYTSSQRERERKQASIGVSFIRRSIDAATVIKTQLRLSQHSLSPSTPVLTRPFLRNSVCACVFFFSSPAAIFTQRRNDPRHVNDLENVCKQTTNYN